jgi:Fanconi anemia group M protein
MIFSQYRDSVNEITQMLNQHRPLVKAMSFIGQSSANKSSRGFTQKEQLKVRWLLCLNAMSIALIFLSF